MQRAESAQVEEPARADTQHLEGGAGVARKVLEQRLER